MKAVLTVAIVLSILLTSAYADTPTERSNENFPTKQNQKNIELLHAKFSCDWQSTSNLSKRTWGTSAVAFRSAWSILGG